MNTTEKNENTTTRSPSRWRKRVLFAIGLVIAAMTLAACQKGDMWQRCSPAADGNPFGQDGTYILACKDAEWVPIMTIGEYLHIKAGHSVTIAPVPKKPAPKPKPVVQAGPESSSSWRTISYLYWDLDAFWRTNFKNWGVSGYYNTKYVTPYTGTTYACGRHLTAQNAWACSAPYAGQMWFDWNWTQQMHNLFGDYASGVIEAHEFGHQVMYDLRLTSTSEVGKELFADCLAGMYTRYGITVSGRLDTGDYAEGYRTLAYLVRNVGTHGTSKNRTDWYEYGYTAYDLNSCKAAL